MSQRWLIPVLLVSAACRPEAPPPAAGQAGRAPSAAPPGLFREITERVGLGAVDLERAADGAYFMPDSMAGGAALADLDGDGRLDLFLAHGRWVDGAPAADGLGRLFVQREDGSFEERSAAAGVVGAHYAQGVAAGDYDNDGDVDLYVTCYGPDVLLRNRGAGTFEDVSVAAGVRGASGTAAWGTSVTFVDVDGDGHLDVFLTNYVDYPPRDQARDSRGMPEYPAPVNYRGVADVLLANLGDGTFRDVTASAGLAGRAGRGLGVAALDLDDDGRVDLYAANDAEANHAWLQRVGGPPEAWRFEECALALGLALSGDGRPEASMGVARGDVDGDGVEDLCLTHLAQETHTLYLSRAAEGPRFADRTVRAGLAAPTVDWTGFGAALVDFDLDGALDLACVHGRVLRGPVRAGASEPARWQPYAEPDLLLRGVPGREPRFEVADAGDFGRRVETSRGLAYGDLDGDGDVDVVVTTAAGKVRVYENLCPSERRSAALAVEVRLGQRAALGATVALQRDGRSERRVVHAAHGYLSSSEPTVRFAGPLEPDARLWVRWPDGVITEQPLGGERRARVTLTR